MAQHSGFFNAYLTEGVYDRTYSAEDYTSNMGAIISTGVRRSGDDDLKVTSNGLQVSAAVGRAWIDGRWYYNDTEYSFDTVIPPTSNSRIDSVVVRANTNASGRKIELAYKVGVAGATPTAPELVRTGGIYEIQLATVTVSAGASNVTVTDTRADTDVCGWVRSPVGYDDYFESLDNNFNAWFEDVKDTLASVTMFKEYTWSSELTEDTDEVVFNIPQYDSTGVDIINVYVNGYRLFASSDYTLTGSALTFTDALSAGSRIVVICYKSIDGTGLGDVSDEITELQDEVAALGDVGQFYYFATGSNDNTALSTLVKAFLNGSATDGKKMKINVVGDTFNCTTPSGSGTAVSPYKWFDFSASPTNREVILDFANCKNINISCTAGTYNVIFSGSNFSLENLTLKAAPSGGYAGLLGMTGFDGIPDTVRNCTLDMTGAKGSGTVNPTCAKAGNFDNCKISVSSIDSDAYCFELGTDILRVTGGDCRAYTASMQKESYCIFGAYNTASRAVIFGTAFPTVSKGSYYQTGAVKVNSGKCKAFGAITSLGISGAGVETFGTI